jgi:hypothetical protein
MAFVFGCYWQRIPKILKAPVIAPELFQWKK